MNTSGWSAMKDLEEIKISCFGRSIGESPLFTKAAFVLICLYRSNQTAPCRCKDHVLS